MLQTEVLKLIRNLSNVSVVLPVKNEPYLPVLLRDLVGYEVLVQTEPGLTNAVLCGIERASNEFVCILDADGSHPVSAIPKMFELLNQYDIVIGSRYVAGGFSDDSFFRVLVSRVFCLFAKTVLQLKVYDCMSGFVATKKSLVLSSNINSDLGYKFLLELLINNPSVKVVEVPICFEKRKAGKSKASAKQAFKIVVLITRLWLSRTTFYKYIKASLK